MRLLFKLDCKNYKENGTIGKRPSARGIIIKNGMLAMVYSKKYDYYKFPGGGIEKNEDNITALIREVKEEVGLVVIPESIKEYGLVLRKEAGKIEDIFIQENFYYLCDVKDSIIKQELDEYEDFEEFTLKWANPNDVIDANLNHDHMEKSSNRAKHMMEREAKVVQILVNEGFFN